MCGSVLREGGEDARKGWTWCDVLLVTSQSLAIHLLLLCWRPTSTFAGRCRSYPRRVHRLDRREQWRGCGRASKTIPRPSVITTFIVILNTLALRD